MCLYPRYIKNKRYLPNKKNDGKPPPVVDLRTEYIPTNCGDCKECRKQKARNWQIRLLEDIKTNTNGKMVTLTFNTRALIELSNYRRKYKNKNGYKTTIKIRKLQGYQRDNAIAIEAVKRFRERHRKKYGKSIRHWLVTELGHKNTEHIHLHGIIWTDQPLTEIEKLWKYGWVWKGQEKNGQIINYVNARTINYSIKYINKIDHDHKTYKPEILTSSGIGKNYTNTINAERNKYKGEKTKETYKTETGHEIALPTYWRNKLYTEEERERLWIQKLDKQIKWVDGIQIDISKGEEEYITIRENARKRNTELGYGNGKHHDELIQKENTKRNEIYNKRLAGGAVKQKG